MQKTPEFLEETRLTMDSKLVSEPVESILEPICNVQINIVSCNNVSLYRKTTVPTTRVHTLPLTRIFTAKLGNESCRLKRKEKNGAEISSCPRKKLSTHHGIGNREVIGHNH